MLPNVELAKGNRCKIMVYFEVVVAVEEGENLILVNPPSPPLTTSRKRSSK
jgi:hypothetical protein